MVEKLEEVSGKLLIKLELTLSLAESCTGGLVGSRLTDVPGSSRYFLGGVLAYSDSIKIELLCVDPGTIQKYGAVSAECAIEMARGARQLTHAQVGIAVTGIAGPDGGTPEKPVGTTFVALATESGEDVQRFQWRGDRISNKRQSADAALTMLIQYLEGHAESAVG